MLGPTPIQNDAKETAQRELIEHFNANLQTNREACAQAWDIAEQNQQFVYGKQWSEDTRRKRKDTNRPLFSMNDIALAVNALSGREMTGRYEAVYIGRTDEDRPWAAVCRRWAKKIRDAARAEHVESDKFRDLNVDNYAWLEWRHVYDGEPSGRTEVVGYDLWQMMWDTSSSKQCLVDRAWDCWGGFVDIDEYCMMFPEDAHRIRERILLSGEKWQGWIVESDQRVTRWPWLHRAQFGRYINQRKREIFLCDYHWREREECFWTYVPPGVYPHPVTTEQLEAIRDQLSANGINPEDLPEDQAAEYGLPEPKLMAFDKKEWSTYQAAYEDWADREGADPVPAVLGPEEGTYRWAFRRAAIVGENVVREWKMPYSRFPRFCMTGFPYKQASGTSFYGLVDLMKDAQRFKNFVYSMAVSLMQRSNKGGMMARPEFFDDWSQVESKLSEPYPILKTSSSARLDGSMHQFLDVNPYPNGVDALLQLAERAAWRPTGMNPDTLGGMQDLRRVSGTVVQSLADVVTQVLAYPFDSLRYYRQDSGSLLLEIQHAYYDEDDVRRVIGPELSPQVKPKSEWIEAGKLDIIVEEIAVSKSERERAWDFGSRQGTWEKMVGQGQMPAKMFVKMLPDGWLSEEDRAEWLAFLQPREELQRLQEQMQLQQLQMQMQQGQPPQPQGPPPEEGQ